MILEIPVRTDLANYKYEIDIEDVTYIFEFIYNIRWNKWILNVYDSDEVIIVGNIPMQTSVDLIDRFYIAGFMIGILLLVDTEGTYEDLTNKDDFGSRFVLTYAESE